MKTFTKKYMYENRGCYSEKQLDACSFMNVEPITLQAIMESEIPVNEKFWFLIKKVLKTKQVKNLAIELADVVLLLLEAEYPDASPNRLAKWTTYAIRDSVDANDASYYVNSAIYYSGFAVAYAARTAARAAYLAAAAPAFVKENPEYIPLLEVILRKYASKYYE